MEAIAAPLAWGCETGSRGKPIAVVDFGFHLVPELTDRVTRRFAVGVFNDSVDHGTKVSGILAAHGDNGEGITGLMWDAELWWYETAADTAGFAVYDELGNRNVTLRNIVDRVLRAGRAGAPVINLSMGTPWPRGYTPYTGVDSLVAFQWGDQLIARLAALSEDYGRTPLLILSAGNEGRRHSGTGFPRREPYFPTR